MRLFPFLFLFLLKTAAAFTPVAFRAVSTILHERRMAQVLAGERGIESVVREARRIAIREGTLAVRSFLDREPLVYKWQNEEIENIVASTPNLHRLVILNADMDTRAYELPLLNNVDVLEVIESKALLHVKESLIAQHGAEIPLLARSVTRVCSTDDIDFAVQSIYITRDFVTPVPLCEGSAVISGALATVPDLSSFGKVLIQQIDDDDEKNLLVAASRFHCSNWDYTARARSDY